MNKDTSACMFLSESSYKEGIVTVKAVGDLMLKKISCGNRNAGNSCPSADVQYVKYFTPAEFQTFQNIFKKDA